MKRSRTPDLQDNKPSAPSEWITPSRVRVKQLKKLGYSGQDIRKETGVPERTQYRWLKGPTRRSEADRPDRFNYLNDQDVKKMIKALKDHYDRRI